MLVGCCSVPLLVVGSLACCVAIFMLLPWLAATGVALYGSLLLFYTALFCLVLDTCTVPEHSG